MADFTDNGVLAFLGTNFEQLSQQEPVDMIPLVPGVNGLMGCTTRLMDHQPQWATSHNLETGDVDLNNLLQSISGDLSEPIRNNSELHHNDLQAQDADCMLDAIINQLPLGSGLEMQGMSVRSGDPYTTLLVHSNNSGCYSPINSPAVNSVHDSTNITPAQSSSSLYQLLRQPTPTRPSTSLIPQTPDTALPYAVNNVTSHEDLDRLMSMMQKQSEALRSTNAHFSDMQSMHMSGSLQSPTFSSESLSTTLTYSAAAGSADKLDINSGSSGAMSSIVPLVIPHKERVPRRVPLTEPHIEHSISEQVTRAATVSNPFQINTSLISTAPMAEQDAELQNLGLTVYNRDDIEQGIMAQVDQALEEEEKERFTKILEKQLKTVTDEIKTVKQELVNAARVERLIGSSPANMEAKKKLSTVLRHKDNKLKQIKKLKAKRRLLMMKLKGDLQTLDSEDEQLLAGDGEVPLTEALGLGSKAKETETERMIRQGEMTPFGTMMSGNKTQGPRLSKTGEMTGFEKYLMDQQQKGSTMKKHTKRKHTDSVHKQIAEHVKFQEKREVSKNSSDSKLASGKHAKNAKLKRRHSLAKAQASGHESSSDESMPVLDKASQPNRFDVKDKRQYHSSEADFSNHRNSKPRFARLQHNFTGDGSISDHQDQGDDEDVYGRDADYEPSQDMFMEEDEESDYLSGNEQAQLPKQKGFKKQKKRSNIGESSYDEASPTKKKNKTAPDFDEDLAPPKRTRDDGDHDVYMRRIKRWKKERLKRKQQKAEADQTDSSDSECEYVDADDGFKVPNKVWNNLYAYQKTCVRWLYELHTQQAGGIVGDEMGLGKTIQIIAFLVGLKISRLLDKGASTQYKGLGPTLIVCPATVLHQWVSEFHKWWPPFRVAILHSSGTFTSSVMQLIDDVSASHSVLVTSYAGLNIHQDALLDCDWHYVVLDEGHKIRNPDAQVTVAAKRIRTCHRLILSGSPVQNNLKELWSLFDFIFPGKLGTLPDFMAHFSVPIVQGGYSTATQVQVQTAYKCACVLRDTINPYLLRRMKSDVRHNLSLPDKNEQVLFCRLSEDQRDVYNEYLNSKECAMILKGEFMVFPGLITLRKVCNHPDLSTGGPQVFESAYHHYPEGEREYGHWKRSGKMHVVRSLLQLWKKQGHRVLLFTQSRQMMVVLELFIISKGYSFLKMDGTTTVSARLPMVNKFNSDPSYFVFLLTTRVGGLGVNLIGANRIIIYDPDWNPSTDMQARERAWRIGQTKQVTIYRLLTAGTIEEKIYHRQIFKQFLTNRVLKDPKQRRLFKANDMHELFTLKEVDPGCITETSTIFAGTGSDVKINKKFANSERPKGCKNGQVASKPNRFDVLLEQKVRANAEIAGDVDEEDATIIGDYIAATTANTKGTHSGKDKRKHKVKGASSIATTAVTNRDSCTDSVSLEGCNLAEGQHGGSVAETKSKSEDEKLQKMKELAKKLSQQFGRLKDDSSNTERAVTNGHIQQGGSKGRSSRHKHKSQQKHSEKDQEHAKHKPKKKHKKKRKKDAVVDGERIAHLAKSETYVQPADNDTEEANNADQDSYVLAKLLNKSGVHSALQHDKIMMSSDPDYALVEGEAERVARESARALKRSRQQCHNARSGIPTWTGQNTTPPPQKPRFGLKKNSKLLPAVTETNSSPSKNIDEKKQEVISSGGESKLFDGTLAGNIQTSTGAAPVALTSAQLLTRMKTRNLLNMKVGGTGPITTNDTNIELITDIRNYIAFQSSINGQASTREIIDYFKDRVGKGVSATFKAMLNQVCDFIKRDGVGMWYLKPEFR